VLSLSSIRSEERRDATVSFLVLLGIMAGHALLETARDALFLAELPASRLPWMYLAIAASVLLLGNLRFGPSDRTGSTLALTLWLLLGATGTLALWALLGDGGARALYALYVWSGVLVSLSVARYWSLLGDLFTVTQAKRLFGPIGAGGILGAVLGAATARALTTTFEARALLVAAAIAFAGAAFPPLWLRRAPATSDGESDPLRRATDAAEFIRNRSYPRRLLALVLVSAFALTLVDYLFKVTVASSVTSDELAPFLASVYLALNVFSFLMQLSVVAWVLRVLGVNRALLVLPVALALGGASVALFGGLAAALLLKGVDGGLRHSLHRTAVELLYVPLTGEMRLSVKSFIEAIGQRGGQALAAVAILAVTALAPSGPLLAAAVIALSLVWCAIALDLRKHYLDLFRESLREGATETRLAFPELDLASLETLMAALNSADDAKVRAAIDLLEEEGRAHLVPALILYHPSRDVVAHALRSFTRAQRADFVPIADRLVSEHHDPAVQAAALRARTAVAAEPERLRALRDSPSAAVAATALVGLAAVDPEARPALRGRIRAIVDSGTREARLALALAVRDRPTEEFTDALLALVAVDDEEIELAALSAMREVRSPEFIAPLIERLARRTTRRAARMALAAIGPPALIELGTALRRGELPIDVRKHIPRTIRQFEPERAAAILLGRLADESDGVVRYKILRSLGRLRANNPSLPLDRTVLIGAAEQTLTAGFRALAWRVALESGGTAKPARATPVQALLLGFLTDKETQAIERLFRVLGLLHPTEDFKRLHRALRGNDRGARSSSRELLENLVSAPLRDPILAIVDDLPDRERLAHAGPFAPEPAGDYEESLHAMLGQRNAPLRALAVYHIGELQLNAMRAELEELRGEPSFLLAEALDRALGRLDPVGGSDP